MLRIKQKKEYGNKKIFQPTRVYHIMCAKALINKHKRQTKARLKKMYNVVNRNIRLQIFLDNHFNTGNVTYNKRIQRLVSRLTPLQ